MHWKIFFLETFCQGPEQTIPSGSNTRKVRFFIARSRYFASFHVFFELLGCRQNAPRKNTFRWTFPEKFYICQSEVYSYLVVQYLWKTPSKSLSQTSKTTLASRHDLSQTMSSFAGVRIPALRKKFFTNLKFSN